MTLIKSISGIRGTIGGKAGDGLSPLDLVKFTSAYATLIEEQRAADKPKKIVVGRDARMSGTMVDKIVVGTLLGMGFDVINIGLATTPTTELAVTGNNACGGIILTASHNPKQWNALKLLNDKGEFLNQEEGEKVLDIAEHESFEFALVDDLGSETAVDYTQKHIDDVLALELVDVEAIKKANFKVALDCVNSVGGIVLPKLLNQLGVQTITTLYGEATGNFQHNPEPLEQNLGDIMQLMTKGEHDIAFVVDPDVDRLAMICEDGKMYGEEYTLVTVADYILSQNPGRNTVSNLSSTRALRDVTNKYGGQYFAAAVGEVNVVTKMKEVNAIIGGEGNGGVIYPESHYGRDALVGIALVLTFLAKKQMKTSELRASYPPYFISKQKIELTAETPVDEILEKVKQKFAGEEINDIDGVKIDFADKWVHLRKSNTEPIIRIYSEASTMQAADELGQQIIDIINSLI